MNAKRLGDSLFAKNEKINSELFTLTYGAIVTQLISDYDDIQAVNEQLEIMGYNIGIRLIDEFIAKSKCKCKNLKDTSEAIAKVGFKMFLGINVRVENFSNDQFSLILEDNPLNDFVDIPEEYSELHYSNVLCGVLRGALEMVQMNCKAEYVRDTLKGDDANEIRVNFLGMLEEAMPINDE
eukprot:TRINITY_DN156_c0_g1_i1.p1 TRINITY_DN156_c0_g1~~TRINITY_DN156_c0_g1_i1.p1  ORF type:complete len:181 (+),score=62.44 TRINITY_DN156_c0_g1_i1:72-614(+)